MRILWVENHAVFIRMARSFLSQHELTIVPSVSAAKAALTQPFDAVLVDYDLDDGKGSEVVGFIRELAVRPVVIATSGRLSSRGGFGASERASAGRVGRVRSDGKMVSQESRRPRSIRPQPAKQCCVEGDQLVQKHRNRTHHPNALALPNAQ